METLRETWEFFVAYVHKERHEILYRLTCNNVRIAYKRYIAHSIYFVDAFYYGQLGLMAIQYISSSLTDT